MNELPYLHQFVHDVGTEQEQRQQYNTLHFLSSFRQIDLKITQFNPHAVMNTLQRAGEYRPTTPCDTTLITTRSN